MLMAIVWGTMSSPHSTSHITSRWYSPSNSRRAAGTNKKTPRSWPWKHIRARTHGPNAVRHLPLIAQSFVSCYDWCFLCGYVCNGMSSQAILLLGTAGEGAGYSLAHRLVQRCASQSARQACIRFFFAGYLILWVGQATATAAAAVVFLASLHTRLA